MQIKTTLTRAHLLFAIASALTVSACGDGGSDTHSLAATSSLTQGRWLSTGLTPAYTAIMVPTPTGANTPAVDTVWALAHDATSLIKLKANGAVQTAGAVTGKVYTLGTSSTSSVSGASYTVSSITATPQFGIQPLLGATALFDRTDAMSTALTPAQANGTWQADLGAVKVNWTVNTAASNVNNLSGSSTSGCTFIGQSTVVSTQSLYKVQFTETCSGGTTETFAGIGTVNPDNTRLTVVATNETESRATALLFVKQP